jgi:hypothetical protein
MVKAEKQHRERIFDDEIDGIQSKAMEEKIQLVEENMKHALKYREKMYR